MSFEAFGLAPPILRAVAAAGYETPTPIQQQAIPHVIEGRDLLGSAQTGTGKTAAFALPILHRLLATQRPGPKRWIRTLVLSPTRELAAQIGENFHNYGRRTKLRQTVIFGGVSQHPQTRDLERGTDIVVATPGRLLDLINQGYVDLGLVETLVVDEADQMLDMGFLPDVRRILSRLPRDRQTLFFSATMPAAIVKLAREILVDPVRVELVPTHRTAAKIEQSVYFVQKRQKPQLLSHFLRSRSFASAIVFARTKHGADTVVRRLDKAGIHSEAIHGNKSQNARQRTLRNFKSGQITVLVATDIAARGIDVSGIEYVINYDLPNQPETYVHRIGRTGRAGAAGHAVSFCSRDERQFLNDIQRQIGRKLPLATDHPEYEESEEAHEDRPQQQRRSPSAAGSTGRPANGAKKNRSAGPYVDANPAPAGESRNKKRATGGSAAKPGGYKGKRHRRPTSPRG